MIDKYLKYAVIGASSNPEKYGHKVFKDLLLADYNVFPINPKGGEILGRKVFTGIDQLENKIDVAIMVVPPAVSEQEVAKAAKAGVKKIWFQPGSESEQAINLCKRFNLEYISNACIMMERKNG